MKKRILIMHFSNKSDPDLPASFSFSANKTRAVLSAATTGNPSINVSWGGATVFSHLVNAGTGYTEFTFNQTASNSLTVLSFFTGGSFTNLFLDDVSVEPAGVGVPDGGSTVSLLGLASLGLVALRRKLRC